MTANLDMDGNRVINIGAPVDDNDAVRLVDIENIIASEGGVVSWSGILGKPSTFPPSAHNHPTSDISGLEEFIEDTVGGNITAGTNVTVNYDDTTGVVTISASGGESSVSSITDYSGVGDNTTDNKSAFDAAEADPDVDWVYIPEGRFYTTNVIDDLTKSYWGPGTIRLAAGDVLPGRFTQVTTNPSPRSGTGASGWFAQDNRFRPEYFRIGQGLRRSLSDNYFDASTQPYSQWFTTGAGWSGISARVASGATLGSTTATLNDAGGFLVGDVVGFVPSYAGGTPTSTVTISDVSGNVITFSPALTETYDVGDVVTHGNRTNHPLYYQRLTTTGGGDTYGIVTRTNMNYVPLPGQKHFFETATFGMYGGDSYFGANGNYTTGLEMAYHDAGYDSAVISSVQSFIRDNDNSNWKGVWIGDLFMSAGTKPADVGWALAGKWRVGLDTVRADLTVFETGDPRSGAAVNMKLGQKIYFNSTNSNSARGGDEGYGNFYGNVLGDLIMESGNDGTSDYWRVKFDRGSPNNTHIRLRPDSVNINTGLSISDALVVGNTITINQSGAKLLLSNNNGEVWIGGQRILTGRQPVPPSYVSGDGVDALGIFYNQLLTVLTNHGLIG